MSKSVIKYSILCVILLLVSACNSEPPKTSQHRRHSITRQRTTKHKVSIKSVYAKNEVKKLIGKDLSIAIKEFGAPVFIYHRPHSYIRLYHFKYDDHLILIYTHHEKSHEIIFQEISKPIKY